MEQKIKHFLYCPLLGLGLFNGARGTRWLKNRILILKQFVVSSLQNQTSKNFTLWISVRPEDKQDKQIKELQTYFSGIQEFQTIFTFHGLCFYDDKFSDDIARNKLITNLHGSIGELLDTIGECDYILFSIQPSDDCHEKNFVKDIQQLFREAPNFQAIGFEQGYIMNYLTGELAEYNPITNPPFYTIKFPRDIFIDPLKHLSYTSLKCDIIE